MKPMLSAFTAIPSNEGERGKEQQIHGRARSGLSWLPTGRDVSHQPHPDAGNDQPRTGKHREVHRPPVRRVCDHPQLVGCRAAEHGMDDGRCGKEDHPEQERDSECANVRVH